MSKSALREAQWFYSHKDEYDREGTLQAIHSLARWQVFSVRQLAKIVGMSVSYVAKHSKGKVDKTGGRFDPLSLEPLLTLSEQADNREQLDPALIDEALNAGLGTSTYMAARLSGISRTRIMRTYKEFGKE